MLVGIRKIGLTYPREWYSNELIRYYGRNTLGSTVKQLIGLK